MRALRQSSSSHCSTEAKDYRLLFHELETQDQSADFASTAYDAYLVQRLSKHFLYATDMW